MLTQQIRNESCVVLSQQHKEESKKSLSKTQACVNSNQLCLQRMIAVNCSLIPPCHLFRDYTLHIMNVLGDTPAEKIKIDNSCDFKQSPSPS